MAYLESAVVVYLRAAFHLSGNLGSATPAASSVWLRLPYFTLLKPGAIAAVLPKSNLACTEVGREAATIVMRLCLGWLAGRSFRTRAAYFIYAFGVWDIGYYVFLYLLIGWPKSLKALDVLFLIPGPWVAPVFVPVAISVLMITAAVLIIRSAER